MGTLLCLHMQLKRIAPLKMKMPFRKTTILIFATIGSLPSYASGVCPKGYFQHPGVHQSTETMIDVNGRLYICKTNAQGYLLDEPCAPGITGKGRFQVELISKQGTPFLFSASKSDRFTTIDCGKMPYCVETHNDLATATNDNFNFGITMTTASHFKYYCEKVQF